MQAVFLHHNISNETILGRILDHERVCICTGGCELAAHM